MFFGGDGSLRQFEGKKAQNNTIRENGNMPWCENTRQTCFIHAKHMHLNFEVGVSYP